MKKAPIISNQCLCNYIELIMAYINHIHVHDDKLGLEVLFLPILSHLLSDQISKANHDSSLYTLVWYKKS